MAWRAKKKVPEPEPQEEEEEEEVPEIEPAPKRSKTKQLKERIQVVYDYPQRQVTQEVIDGVLVKYITMAEALTDIINEEE